MFDHKAVLKSLDNALHCNIVEIWLYLLCSMFNNWSTQ